MQKLALQASSAEAWNKGYVESWHKVRAQPGAYEGTETAALPTLIVAFQIRVRGIASTYT
jgi:hypothetical protein